MNNRLALLKCLNYMIDRMREFIHGDIFWRDRYRILGTECMPHIGNSYRLRPGVYTYSILKQHFECFLPEILLEFNVSHKFYRYLMNSIRTLDFFRLMHTKNKKTVHKLFNELINKYYKEERC